MRLREEESESEDRMTRTTYDTSCILMRSRVTYVQRGAYMLVHAHTIKGDTNCQCCVKFRCLID